MTDVAHRARTAILARTGQRTLAIAVEDAIEIMRPMPIEPMPGLPAYVLGTALIRGLPTPVLDLARLLGETTGGPGSRFVIVRDGDRFLALALQQVIGLRAMEAGAWQTLPSLLEGAAPHVTALGVLPEGLVSLLRTGRLCPSEVWSRVPAAEAQRP